ncbi:sigma-E factor negative regulatory protein [Ferrimonas senticii]|uniref:sigma-E factor negative regulatory protein n=1 Tax=Ferrimonas senticii TaxID=394566 RepID=UPI00041E60FA|nr:RseA family anti-sigma factor [Ferrimonas senticii]
MVTDNKAQLSAFIDGHGQHDDIDAIMADEQLQQRWQNYHLIGDAMRGDLPNQLNFDIAAGVAAALADEPTVLAPKPSKRRFAMPAKVVQLGKQFGQYAIAAGVAAVAVVGVQQYGAEDIDSPMPVLQTRAMLGAPTPASYQVPGMGQPQPEMSAEQEALEQQKRANAFLRDHLLQQRLNGIVVAN